MVGFTIITRNDCLVLFTVVQSQSPITTEFHITQNHRIIHTLLGQFSSKLIFLQFRSASGDFGQDSDYQDKTKTMAATDISLQSGHMKLVETTSS